MVYEYRVTVVYVNLAAGTTVTPKTGETTSISRDQVAYPETVGFLLMWVLPLIILSFLGSFTLTVALLIRDISNNAVKLEVILRVGVGYGVLDGGGGGSGGWGCSGA